MKSKHSHYFDEEACMRYSYLLLTGKKTMEELLEEGDKLILLFNPEKPTVVMIDDIYDVLIDYFITTEEYEKCAEIKKAKQKASRKQAQQARP